MRNRLGKLHSLQLCQLPLQPKIDQWNEKAGNSIKSISWGARLNFIPQYAQAPSAPNMNIATGIAFMLIFNAGHRRI
ncbi:MAG: hypothetical protein ACRD40_07045 [Candidatus Acidiferrales bacterium]